MTSKEVDTLSPSFGNVKISDNTLNDVDSASPVHFGRSNLVTILVGPEKQRYVYHKAILCAKSPYFAASLKDAWNGSKNEIVFEDIAPEIFEGIMDCIYGQTTPKAIISSCAVSSSEIKHEVQLYRLADYLCLYKLKNDLLDAIIENRKTNSETYNFNGLNQIADAGLEHSKLFDMALRSCVRHFMRYPEQYSGAKNGRKFSELDSNPTIMRLMLESIQEYNLKTWGPVWEFDKCKFHDHSDGSSCEK